MKILKTLLTVTVAFTPLENFLWAPLNRRVYFKLLGVIDDATEETMKIPRCGHPDIIRTNSKKQKRFVLYGKTFSASVNCELIRMHRLAFALHKFT